MANLEVQIGADNSDFKKKIAEIESDIKDLSKIKLEQIKLGLDTKTITSQINDAKKTLNDLKTSVKDTGNSFNTAAPKIANGGNALMQFSRIAQDAPYGIIGIGNNITATVESFGHLKNSTGSASGALKAMATSLMGSGGILLGVSLLTTGLTLMAQSGLSVGDVINKITGDFDKFGSELNKMYVEAAKNSGTEIAGLKSLISVAQDETKSRKDRSIAVQELQDKYPAYFGNLSKENILTGDLTLITKELSKAIIARAEATAIADKIGELASKKLELQIKKEKAILKLKQAQSNVKNNVTVTGGTIGAAGLSNEGRFSSSVSTVKGLNQQIYDIQVQQDKLANKLNQKESESIKLLEKKVSLKKQEQTFNTPQVSGLKASINPQGLAETSGNIMQIAKGIQGAEGLITTSMGNIRMVVDGNLSAMNEALLNFNESASDIINNGISGAFSNLGQAIGDSLANGGNVLESVGKTLLSSLGGILTNLGTMAIQVGVGLLGIKAALKTLNPAAAIAAGVGLIALGSFFSSKSASIGNSMGGSKGLQAGNSVSSPSSSTGNSGGGSSFTNGTVVFEISGQSLIGVLSNTLDKNRRLGGSLVIV